MPQRWHLKRHRSGDPFSVMEIPLVDVPRGMTVVLAVGAPKAIHPTVSPSPSQVLQGHRETLQQLFWGLHNAALATLLGWQRLGVKVITDRCFHLFLVTITPSDTQTIWMPTSTQRVVLTILTD